MLSFIWHKNRNIAAKPLAFFIINIPNVYNRSLKFKGSIILSIKFTINITNNYYLNTGFMSNNYNKQDENKNGKAFSDLPNSTQERRALTAGKNINKKPDLLRLKLIYEEFPDHCVQFFFLS